MHVPLEAEELRAYEGQWRLVRRGEMSVELDVEDPESSMAPDAWLRGSGPTPLHALQGASGLLLQVSPEGEVAEHATEEARFGWFDQDGVLEAQAVPFPGRLATLAGEVILLTDAAEAPLRYDDGDTSIAEQWMIRTTPSRQLVRTVSVVTDGLYGDRHMYIYERVSS